MELKAAHCRRLAQVSAWLALLCGILILYLSFVLFDFFPPAAAGARVQIYLLNFAGMVLGAALCPLFLPLPFSPEVSGRNSFAAKKPWVSAAFIALAIAPNIVVRSLGVSFWLGSMPARILMALSSGMWQPIGFGLFYLTRLDLPSSSSVPSPNRTGRWTSFLFAVIMMTAVIIHNGATPLLERSGLAASPMRAMTLLFNMLKWVAIVLSLSAVTCVFALHKGRETAVARGIEAPTNWRMIARLGGLAVTFFTLNSLLETRLFPLVSGVVGAYRPFYPAVVLAVLLLGFMAGRSALFVKGKVGRFLRILLLPMVMLFILMPVLHFLNYEYRFFALVMNSLISIAHFSVWIIFTTALVELYRGQKFFYALASSIIFMYIFAFLGPLLGPIIPKGLGFMVLVSAMAALLFTLLAFRVLFPGLPLLTENEPETPTYSLHTIFLEHGLSEKEAEVARLIVTEGLSNQKIADRIFRSRYTVEKHLTSIYRKFGVPDRTAFLAKVLK